MTIIAVINQKGGCGKTTTSVNLAAALAVRGKRVLIIDLDPQGHVSYALNLNPDQFTKNIFNVLCDNISISEIIYKYNDQIDLAPSNLLLATAEQILSGQENREIKLKDKLQKVAQEYNFIIIDCPPNFGFLSLNALIAAQKAIVPIEPGKFGLNGMEQLHSTLKMLREKAGVNPEIRHLVSMYDIDSEFSRKFVEDLKSRIPDTLFESVINRTTAIREATSSGVPVCYHNIHSVSYVDYLELAQEVILWSDQKLIQEVVAKRQVGPVFTSEGVCFLIKAVGATNVQLAGDFNNWNPEKHKLTKAISKEGLWYTILPLQKGKYSYRYVVDGDWQEDKNNPVFEESLFGVKQSIITI